jgi:hypothetical protein
VTDQRGHEGEGGQQANGHHGNGGPVDWHVGAPLEASR